MDDAGLTAAGRGAVWITRAAPGAHSTARRVVALGFEPLVESLIETRPLAVATPDLAGVVALAFTSAAAVRAFAVLSADRTLPVFAVGDATARIARDAGWAQVRSAAGDVAALAALLAAEAPRGRVLAPGARRPAGELPHAERLAIYDTARTAGPWPLAAEALARSRLRAVLVQSPSAAEALTAGGLASRRTEALALSAACAAPLRTRDWAAVRIADRADEPALLNLLRAADGAAPWRPAAGPL